ncbi:MULTISPECIES: DedA family protein [Bacillaceae]|uniref:DedA family protein n=1 Tax=Bacillaceae TaxID=186817 RepID=UPI001E340217|nr:MULTISPECIES: DedA family protein [Bacillaceae]MCE4046887.1 DedA family protein [Bacillus sp. Au-Bac7]MCM3029990.1 DedA family protein [Niallia sp. MER 6]MDL0436284.1 DedA family protein [Niallia sp. SS-2023]UPO86722.1 DedA family protein [Niallia sp. Man26]
MDNWITHTMEEFGYIGILLLITLENIFPPIPSEIILTFGGFMTTYTDMTVLGVVAVSTIGSVLGAVILYWVGTLLNMEKIESIVDKWGHIIRLTKEDVHKANGWFEKYGYWTVFFCRFIPLIRSLISLPAGMAKMNFAIFLVLTSLGTLIWNFVLIRIGAAVGDSWETIVGYMDIYSNIIYAIIAIAIIAFLFLYIRKRLVKS